MNGDGEGRFRAYRTEGWERKERTQIDDKEGLGVETDVDLINEAV